MKMKTVCSSSLHWLHTYSRDYHPNFFLGSFGSSFSLIAHNVSLLQGQWQCSSPGLIHKDFCLQAGIRTLPFRTDLPVYGRIQNTGSDAISVDSDPWRAILSASSLPGIFEYPGTRIRTFRSDGQVSAATGGNFTPTGFICCCYFLLITSGTDSSPLFLLWIFLC